jgi:hypothetical protein
VRRRDDLSRSLVVDLPDAKQNAMDLGRVRRCVGSEELICVKAGLSREWTGRIKISSN